MRIFFNGITHGSTESNLGFATMLLNIPFSVKCDINIEFSSTIMEGLDKFLANRAAFDMYICFPTNMNNLEFLKRALAAVPSEGRIILGNHVIPRVDWEGIARGDPLLRFEYDVPADDSGDYHALDTAQKPLTRLPAVIAAATAAFEGVSGPLEEAGLLKHINARGAVVDRQAIIDVYGKNVFRGCVGLRSHLR